MAGAVNSPRILMLSGIVPVDDLQRLGIPVKAPSPDVGGNLQDHAQVPIMVECREKWGYYRDGVGFRMLVNGMRYLAFRDGPASGSGIESNSYFNPDDLNAAPTIQTFHNPALLSASLGKPLPIPGMTFVNVVMQPRSRGDVRLRNDDPTSAPLINPNWFGDPEDVRKSLAAGVEGCTLSRDDTGGSTSRMKTSSTNHAGTLATATATPIAPSIFNM